MGWQPDEIYGLAARRNLWAGKPTKTMRAAWLWQCGDPLPQAARNGDECGWSLGDGNSSSAVGLRLDQRRARSRRAHRWASGPAFSALHAFRRAKHDDDTDDHGDGDGDAGDAVDDR